MYSVWQKPDEHNRVCEMKNMIKKNSVDVNFNIDEQMFTQVSLSLVSDIWDENSSLLRTTLFSMHDVEVFWLLEAFVYNVILHVWVSFRAGIALHRQPECIQLGTHKIYKTWS